MQKGEYRTIRAGEDVEAEMSTQRVGALSLVRLRLERLDRLACPA